MAVFKSRSMSATASGFSTNRIDQSSEKLTEKRKIIILVRDGRRSLSKFRSGTSTVRQMPKAIKNTIKIVPK